MSKRRLKGKIRWAKMNTLNKDAINEKGEIDMNEENRFNKHEYSVFNIENNDDHVRVIFEPSITIGQSEYVITLQKQTNGQVINISCGDCGNVLAFSKLNIKRLIPILSIFIKCENYDEFWKMINHLLCKIADAKCHNCDMTIEQALNEINREKEPTE